MESRFGPFRDLAENLKPQRSARPAGVFLWPRVQCTRALEEAILGGEFSQFRPALLSVQECDL